MRDRRHCRDPSLSRTSWGVSRARDCKWSSDTLPAGCNRDTWNAAICRTRTSRASSGPCRWRTVYRSACRRTACVGERNIRRWHLKSKRPLRLEKKDERATDSSIQTGHPPSTTIVQLHLPRRKAVPLLRRENGWVKGHSTITRLAAILLSFPS